MTLLVARDAQVTTHGWVFRFGAASGKARVINRSCCMMAVNGSRRREATMKRRHIFCFVFFLLSCPGFAAALTVIYVYDIRSIIHPCEHLAIVIFMLCPTCASMLSGVFGNRLTFFTAPWLIPTCPFWVKFVVDFPWISFGKCTFRKMQLLNSEY